MTTHKNFSHLFCNPINLENYKKQIKAINKSYSNDLIEYLFIQNNEEYKEYLFRDYRHLEDTLKRENVVKFIDNISTEYSFETNSYIPKFEIFENLNKIKFKIDDSELETEDKRKEGWGIVTIDLETKIEEDPKEKGKQIITYSLIEFELFDLSVDDNSLNSFMSLRSEYSLHGWINLLLYSLGYSSEALNFKEKITLIARAIPFCEKNFSLLEIGSRGTGKSNFYNIHRNKSIKIYTDTPTVANLFYNNSNNKVGSIKEKNVIVIDEAHQMSFKEDLSTMFKSYLDNGAFDRGEDDASDCSIVFLGNYDNFNESYQNPEKIITNLKNKFFCDTAILERISFISNGWEVPKYKDPIDTSREKLLPSFLIKILEKLKDENFEDFIGEKIEFDKALNKREKKNIIKTVSGLLKILHPNKVIRDKELIAYLSIAAENQQYKLSLKQYIEDPDNSIKNKEKSEFKLPSPIFIPKNEAYKQNVDIINKEFILYNYIDLFISNYSLKDFIPIAKEFELDNSNNTFINFFPINRVDNTKKKEIKLIGDILTVDHPYFDNEVLNIAISLTGTYENKGKVDFFNSFINKEALNSLSFLNKFDELGSHSNDFILLTSKNGNKKNVASYLSQTNKKYFSLRGEKNKTNYYLDKNAYVPFFPKNIYSSLDFNFDNLYNYYGSFRIINSIDPNIEISSINYIIDEEIYEVEYIKQLPKKFPPYSSESEVKRERLKINELIVLLEEKDKA